MMFRKTKQDEKSPCWNYFQHTSPKVSRRRSEISFLLLCLSFSLSLSLSATLSFYFDDQRRRLTTRTRRVLSFHFNAHAAWLLLKTGSQLARRRSTLCETRWMSMRRTKQHSREILWTSECKRKDQIDITHSTRPNMGIWIWIYIQKPTWNSLNQYLLKLYNYSVIGQYQKPECVSRERVTLHAYLTLMVVMVVR